jgi:hypothetical protein
MSGELAGEGVGELAQVFAARGEGDLFSLPGRTQAGSDGEALGIAIQRAVQKIAAGPERRGAVLKGFFPFERRHLRALEHPKRGVVHEAMGEEEAEFIFLVGGVPTGADGADAQDREGDARGRRVMQGAEIGRELLGFDGRPFGGAGNGQRERFLEQHDAGGDGDQADGEEFACGIRGEEQEGIGMQELADVIRGGAIEAGGLEAQFIGDLVDLGALEDFDAGLLGKSGGEEGADGFGGVRADDGEAEFCTIGGVAFGEEQEDAQEQETTEQRPAGGTS